MSWTEVDRNFNNSVVSSSLLHRPNRVPQVRSSVVLDDFIILAAAVIFANGVSKHCGLVSE